MARKASPPIARSVSADDVDPRHRWDRPLQAPGHTQVDFEERVDFKRLHAYRLGRARQALSKSGLGAVLVKRLDGAGNVTPVLSRDDDPMLPPNRRRSIMVLPPWRCVCGGW